MKELMTVFCKYCGELDTKENMHEDKYTGEYYHEQCQERFTKVSKEIPV